MNPIGKVRAPDHTQTDELVYIAESRTTDIRDGGGSVTSDDRLAACFVSGTKLTGSRVKIRVPEDATIEAEVGLWFDGESYLLKASLTISLLGVDREIAQALTHASEGTCPYANDADGNIDVVITLV
jgi:hypothetical protein